MLIKLKMQMKSLFYAKKNNNNIIFKLLNANILFMLASLSYISL